MALYGRNLPRPFPQPEVRDERLMQSRNAGYVTGRPDAATIARTARLMRRRSPARRLMSRHTRETLRQYVREGLRQYAVFPAPGACANTSARAASRRPSPTAKSIP